MTTKHSIYSPSSAYRWTLCPYSQLYREIRKDDGPSAQVGTYIHDLAWSSMTGHPLDTPIPSHLSPKDMLDLRSKLEKHWLQPLRELIKKMRAEDPETLVFLETEWDFSRIIGVMPNNEPAFGTADVVLVNKDEIVIWDLKTGFTENSDAVYPQLMLYAAGVCDKIIGSSSNYRNRSIRLEAVFIRSGRRIVFDLTLDEVIAWCREVVTSVVNDINLVTQDPLEARSRLKPTPGTLQCQYCPGNKVCPAWRDKINTAVSDQSLSDETIAMIPVVRKWLKTVVDAVKEKLNDGVSVPRYALVNGRTITKWTNQRAVTAGLLELNTAQELIEKYGLDLPTPNRLLEEYETASDREKAIVAGILAYSQSVRVQSLRSQQDDGNNFEPINEVIA